MKILKSFFLIVCAVFLLQSCMISRKANIEFFTDSGHDFKGAKFMSVNVPMFLAKPYIKRALREDNKNEEVVRLVKKVSKIKILMVENGDQSMLKDFTKYLNDNNYEDWATIKHDGDNVNVRIKQSGENINNMLITVNSDNKDLVFVDVKGSFTPDDVSRIINSASDK